MLVTIFAVCALPRCGEFGGRCVCNDVKRGSKFTLSEAREKVSTPWLLVRRRRRQNRSV